VRAWDDKFPCFVLITITTHENGKRFIIFHLSYRRPFERCPVCGGRVQLPCIACIVRRLERPIRWRPDRYEPLELALEDEHRKRYIKVKEWRERQDDPDFCVIPEHWPFRMKIPFADKELKNEYE